MKLVSIAGSLLLVLALAITGAPPPASYGSPLVSSIVRIQPAGSRARFTPDGKYLIFDRRNSDGYYQLYLSDLAGNVLPTSLTKGRNITQLDNGNNDVMPNTGKVIAFVSETNPHYLSTVPPAGQVPIGDPGVGLFSNLWFTDGINFAQQTLIPIKLFPDDGIPPMATVNPRFKPDGSMLVWTERYDNGGAQNWGMWRLRAADIVPSQPGNPVAVSAVNQRVIFTPPVGYYVTAMGFLSPTKLLVSGNLNGQHPFGMDLYSLDLTTGAYTNLTNSPQFWKEGSCIAPSGKIVFMSNQDSPFTLDQGKSWVGQPLTREYYVMNPDGSGQQRLTYFNDSTAQEYTGWRTVPIVCSMSPDGMTIAATVGHDYGTPTAAYLVWEVWLIRLKNPL